MTTKSQATIGSLEERCRDGERALAETKRELAEVRKRTSALVAKAEDRMAWMDRYFLGPETFERRRYMRILVEGLALFRRIANRLRKLRPGS